MSSYIKFSDEELLSFIKKNDEKAFSELYSRFWSILYIYVQKFIQDKAEAEDVVQELFIYVWNNAQSIELRSTLSSYLYAAARYKIFDWMDKQKVRDKYVQSLHTFINQSNFITDNHIRERELSRQIESVISTLPLKMKEVFLLSRQQNLPSREIASQLNISQETVKKQISKALKILKLKLGLWLSILLFFL